jgi:MFS family permease
MLSRRAAYPWLLVALLWVVAALNYVDRQVIFSLFPLLRTDLHLSSMQLGMLGTVFLWVYGAASPLGGYLADRFSRRKVILASFAIWSAVTLLLGLARSYGQVLTAQALMGLSEACYLPAALALIADFHPDASRSRAIGLHQSGLYCGVALGGFGGGWVGEHYGWHGVFTVLGTGGLVYLLVLVAGLKDAPPRQPALGQIEKTLRFLPSLQELLGNAPFLLLVLANGLVAVSFWCIYAWLASFLFERFRMSLALAGFTATFYIQAASFAGVLGGGWLADRWSQRNGRARGWTQTFGLLLAGPALFLIAGTGSWWILIPCLLGFGVGRGFWDCNLMPLLCQIISSRLRATAFGVLNFTACICGGVMALVAGYLKEKTGLAMALEISAVCIVAAALCVALLNRFWLHQCALRPEHGAAEARTAS